MRFAGIDIASETHVVAVVDVEGKSLVKATEFTEGACTASSTWGSPSSRAT